MKQYKKVVIFILSFFVFCKAFCEDGFIIKEIYEEIDYKPIPEWSTKNKNGKYDCYNYYIESAPQDYEYLINKYLFYDGSWIAISGVGNMFSIPSLDKITEAIKKNNFYIMDFEGERYMCLCNPLNLISFKEQKDFIYKLFKTKYAGFSDMKEKGFNKKIWNKAETFDDLVKIFDEYICDNHFYVYGNGKVLYRRKQIFDEGTKKSEDRDYTFFSKNTSNTLYIRCNNCNPNWEKYQTLPNLAYEALIRDYIVLDFRSNCGGSDGPQYAFFDNLKALNYKGTIYILQDNWSYSSGEAWDVASHYSDDLKFVLVGTHSGGMQNYGNVELFSKKNFSVNIPTTKFPNLPSNYLGEGIGYEPQIWATTENMKKVLTEAGLDLEGIEFN